jgi:hypothetical protein
MEPFPVDIEPNVRWIIAEHRMTPSSLKIVARRAAEERQIPARAEFHLGDEEREDLSEIATVATPEIGPSHPSEGRLMTIVVEDEIGPRGPGRGTMVEDEQQIDLETFNSRFIRPERGTATFAAQANEPRPRLVYPACSVPSRTIDTVPVLASTSEQDERGLFVPSPNRIRICVRSHREELFE